MGGRRTFFILSLLIVLFSLSYLQREILRLAGVNAALRYYIDTGNEQNSFSLEAKTGALTLARKLDFETR